MEGRLLFLACLLASMAAVTYSQGYTRQFFWDGMTTLIAEPDGSPISVRERIYIQLPNVSTPLDVRVREGVNTTLDCGLRIDAIMPSLVTRNVRTFWSLRRRQVDGGLEAPSNVTNADDEIEIFGNNDRFLRTPNPILASRARQTNIGLFNCTVCFEQHSPLPGNPYLRTICDSSSGEPNVIGYPPIINRNGSLTGRLRIGTPICLDYASTRKDEVEVVCAPLPGALPVAAAAYTSTVAPFGDYFDTDVLSGELGENNLVYVYTEIFIERNVVGSVTCNNSNRFGFDVETTVIQRNVTSTFTGNINNSAASQCLFTTAPNVLCPAVGQRVNLNCGTNFMYPYNITSPDSSIASDRNLSFTMGTNDYGTYTCNSMNDCNGVMNTIRLEQCIVPEIITFGPRTGDNTPLNNLCSRNLPQNTHIDCIIDPSNASQLIRRVWMIDGVIDNEISDAIEVLGPGNYTCTIIHPCGTRSIGPFFIPRDPPMIMTGSGIVVDPPGPVDVGNRVCVNASSSFSAQLNCRLTNPNESRISNITWSPGGNTQVGVTSALLTVNMVGTYTCLAENDCGNNTASTIVENYPSIVKGSGQSTASTVDIGTDACTSGDSVQIRCNLAGNLNLPRRWSRNGTTLGETGSTLTVPRGTTGVYRCEVSNDCDTDSATTTVRSTPMASISGSIVGVSGDGCTPPSGGSRLCVSANMRVTITCSANAADGYTITGPGGASSTNQSLSFTVTSGSYGDYVCRSSNPCANATSTIRLEPAACPLPRVNVTVQRGDGTLASSPCVRSDNDLFVSCVDSLSGSNVEWFVNGVRQGSTGNRLRATVSGNYTCITTSTCGDVTNTTFIKEAPTVERGSGIVINPGSTPVPAGARTCISQSGSGSRVNLVCNLAFNNGSVTTVSFTWSVPGGGTRNGPNIVASSAGTYRCTASNLCGSTEASTEILERVTQTKGSGTGVDVSSVNIGTRLCLNMNDQATINCMASGTGITRTWRRDNTVISGVTGETYTAQASDRGSTITCMVMNDCGSDQASTEVTTQVPVTINGTISSLNISDSGCARPGITTPNADLCPLDGEKVNVTCASSGGYIIRGPRGRMSRNAPLIIDSFILSDSGTYTCSSENDVCGTATDSILISGTGVPPVISTRPPDPSPPTLPPTIMNDTITIGTDICLLEHQFVTIECMTLSGTQPIAFTWTSASTGNRVISTGMRLTVRDPDTYTCNATNAFGSANASSKVARRLSVNLDDVGRQGNRCGQLKSQPVGVDFCAFVGDTLTLVCRVNAPNITTMIYIGRMSSSEIPLTPVLPTANGNYLCNATNDCGTSSDMINLRVYDPARIDRQLTLPTPGPNEEVIGAGRPDEPNEITPGKTVRLYCPFIGIDPANTTWVRVRPDGFTAPINTSHPAFSIDNTGNVSVLVISPFTREHEGTYRCTTTNIAGDDEGDVVLQASPEVIPEWVTTPWTECEPKCHKGMRMRLVHCVDRVSQRRLSDNMCPAPKPITMEQCINAGPCFTTPKWLPGNWTQCTVPCGGGYRTRKIVCVIPLNGNIVPHNQCKGKKPRDHEYCNTHSCCVKDLYKACKHIAGTHSCSFGYMKTICCWTCRHYHYY